ncbi:MAG TPA: PfkB family carbohydrate kinase [Longimicrobiales bacterium]
MRVGVVGTMVWDRIYARDQRREPVEEWGGISYALSAAEAAAGDDWQIVPIMKVGADLRDRAFSFLRTLPKLQLDAAIQIVPEPNNRVELRYSDQERRCERLTGGVPPWRWEEIAPALPALDALYINFISGFEMDLETARKLRIAFPGPIYADLHSLMLGVDATGMRVPKPMHEWREWIHCFDIVQVNEDELGLLAHFWGDPWRFAAEAVGDELRLLVVTMGSRGAAFIAAPAYQDQPLGWRRTGLHVNKTLSRPGTTASELIPAEPTSGEGDPTGCGDVWGATFFCRLLAGDPLRVAMTEANRMAARNVQHRGASGLHHYLKGKLGA